MFSAPVLDLNARMVWVSFPLGLNSRDSPSTCRQRTQALRQVRHGKGQIHRGITAEFANHLTSAIYGRVRNDDEPRFRVGVSNLMQTMTHLRVCQISNDHNRSKLFTAGARYRRGAV